MPDGSFGNIGSLMPTPPGRDDEIMSFCAAILRLRQVSEELRHPAPCGSPAERALDRTYAQLKRQQTAMTRHMCRLRAYSREAHQQRALLLGAWIPDEYKPSMTWADDDDAMRVLDALVRDLISDAFDD